MGDLRSRVEALWAPLRVSSSPADFERLDAFLATVTGDAPPQSLDTGQGYGPCPLHLPGLAPSPWCDPAGVEGADILKANWEEIRDEALAIYRAGDHLLQVATEDEQRGWYQYFFWDFRLFSDGRRGAEQPCVRFDIPGQLDRCPATAAALSHLNPYSQAGFLFLEPGGVIHPHKATANWLPVLHLGLKIPPDCGIRVADEARTWAEGELLCFDHTFDHEAWNRSDEMRAVLFIRVLSPDLTPTERSAFRVMLEGLTARETRTIAQLTEGPYGA
jgi:aspartyl/asparaginyl beta-hydroxylase (cupin superfamily)